MAIPDFQSLMLPLLKESAAGEVRISDVVAVLGDKLALTESELSELLPSGKQTTFANRVNWAKSYLGKAGLIDLCRKGHFKKGENVVFLHTGGAVALYGYTDAFNGLKPL